MDDRIRRVSAGGIITTFAGTGAAGFSGDGGPATKATFRGPRGVAVGSDSSIYIADSTNNRIRRVEVTGDIDTFAGNNIGGVQGDGGPISGASLDLPVDLAFTPNGTLLVADFNGLRVRAISGGMISTIAGNGNFRYGGDGGPSGDAFLPSPSGLAVDANGNVHLCDTFANRVRTIDSFGVINLTAGTNIPGFAGDNGPATSASLSDCEAIAADSSGNLYVADSGNERIRKIDAAGVISTFAGNGRNAFSGDGQQASKAGLSLPQGVAVDIHGNVYIADTGNNRVRKVNSSGIISTIAGNGKPGYSGDHGPATAAELNGPTRVAIDSAGDVYVSDNGNNVVRRISSGKITTVAGNGQSGFSGDNGPATSASLANPQGLTLDESGALYIADFDNNRIRRVSRNGVISTFAGTGAAVGSGNGRSPQLAGLSGPIDVAIDNSGNIYIATRTGARIRRVQPAPSSIVVSQVGITFHAAVDGASVPLHKLRILNGGAGTISWTAKARTLLGGSWLKISPTEGTSSSTSTSSPVTVSVNPKGLAARTYYGQIRIVSPGVANSPRFVTVVLNVLSAAATAGPSVDPAGLLFTGTLGGTNPSPQALTVSKLHGKALQFTTSLSPAAPWLSVQPTKGRSHLAGRSASRSRRI
jgi:sugar lactone lactonase YvrE